jgi:ATP-binding cassette subfamily C (CFTR/MRP) protein 4
LLGELKAQKGGVELVGRVSYASQIPWVFSGTVRENILFGSQLDKDRYDRVVEACGLRQVCDIAVYPAA